MPVLTIIYITVVVVSMIVAVLLIRFAQFSGRSHAVWEHKDSKPQPFQNDLYNMEEIKKNVYDEIKGITDSKHYEKIASNIVTNIFDREIKKTIGQKTQELSQRYRTVIEQSVKNEEIAWEKYKNTLSEKKETEAIVRSIAEGLVVVNTKGDVIMLNPAAERLLGASKKDKIGRPVLENLKEDELITTTKGSDKENKEVEFISKQDETKKILRSSSAVIENENGQTIGMVSVLSDITKQRELERLKQNFVSNVTHELRTPLIATRKSIVLLLTQSTGQITAAQEHFLSLADRNLKRLSILIDDLLDLSKMESGKMELKLESASIQMAIEESVENLKTWAASKSVNIESHIQQDMPQISIDSSRIIQVMNNLIGNAIKFTPVKGTITVKAGLSKDTDTVQVSVEDTGAGVKREDLNRIFEKFYQTGERNYTDIGGTGIGLAIVKEIVELHGGKIIVESPEGKGAKFIFSLPAKQDIEKVKED
jgi:PAS domain S-box-containing protein